MQHRLLLDRFHHLQLRSCLCAGILGCLAVAGHASTCVVNNNKDDPNDASGKVTALSPLAWSGASKSIVTLRDCIVDANLMTGSTGVPTLPALTIDLSKIAGQTIALQDALPLVFNNLQITAAGSKPVTIEGGDAHRIFFVSGLPSFKTSNLPDPDGSQATSVILNNLILRGGIAHGGDGAGGGMGAGGALFVNKAATVTLINVAFANNVAMGGNALSLDDYLIMSGGGMGAGLSDFRGGGSLGGATPYDGGAGIGTAGTPSLPGGFGGTGIGQLSINQNFSLADFDVDTGSGTLGSLIGGGGLAANGIVAHNGGFGGGGGCDEQSPRSGDGGFGGGGAWAQLTGQPGGNGGFGGGGGGAFFFGTSGNGGFGAGAGAYADFGVAGTSGVGGGEPNMSFGGGGAGFGGAVFVRSGGVLRIDSSLAQNGSASNKVIAGVGFNMDAAAVGSGMFLMAGSETIFNVTGTYTVSDDIADDSSTSLPAGRSYTPGNGGGASISKIGSGSLVLDGANSYAGITDIQAGTLAGIGIVAGRVRLESFAQVAPGDPSIAGGVGTLSTGEFLWYTGATMAFQLGADDAGSDHLVVDGALLKGNGGKFNFHFGRGAAPPTVGAVYTLIASTDTSEFSAQDFSFDTDATLQSLAGTFEVDPTAVRFVVTSVQP